MKVALIGATGAVGQRLLAELTARGHRVTAIARGADAIAASPQVTPRKADVFNEAELTAALAGHEAVISAVWFSASDPALLIRAVRNAGVGRYLVVGGAGSLELAPGATSGAERQGGDGPGVSEPGAGLRLYDTDQFPEAWKPEARAGGAFLELLRQTEGLDWTFLSPSAMLEPGVRTGTFRLGGDQLLTDANGKSHISLEDYAVAMVDELERPAHSRRRFTVGY